MRRLSTFTGEKGLDRLLWYLYRRRLYQIIQEDETPPHEENFKEGA